MAGDVSTLRVAGYPAGYPAEIDANVKIRWVDNLLINMSEQSTDFLKFIGGPAQFTFTNPKVEWVEDDAWGRRPTHSGLAAAATTSWTITAQAHRYPVGTLFRHVPSGEVARVAAIIDINTVRLTRDVPGTVSEGAWASTDEVIVSGFAMNEDDNWVFRPSAILTLPFNYAQIHSLGIQASFRRLATQFYGLNGTDLDYQSANTLAEQFVDMEGELLTGIRSVGSGAENPAMMGGVTFYVTSANGAYISTLTSATAITRKDIDDMMQSLWYAVGPEKMARTLVGSAWVQRKVTSFFAGAERIQSGATSAGTSIRSFLSDFGPINIVVDTQVGKDELFALNADMIKMGNYAGLGKPHLMQLPMPSATGPRVQRAFYADLSAMVKGVQGMGIINRFSVQA